MKAKTFISIIAFVSALAFSTAISENVSQVSVDNNVTQQKIYQLLEQNRLNELSKIEKLRERNFKISGTQPETFLNPLKEYGEASERLNSAELPEDFRVAWKRYATIEREWADFLAHLESMPDETVLNEAEKPIAEQKIAEEKEAWQDVVKTAKKYGVMVNVNGSVYLKLD